MCHHDTVRLPNTPSSTRAARSFVAGRLDRWGATAEDIANGQAIDAVLVVSELVSNAVKFSSSEVEVRLDTHRDRIEIAVSDDNPGRAELQRPDSRIPGGRGLVIVRALSEKWGQEWREDHKTVWAHLRLPLGSDLGRGCQLPKG
jgi:anti-sigma regulatory factor (Ser/Thr protein kinase)